MQTKGRVQGWTREAGRKEGRELTVASVIVLNEGRMKDGAVL